MHNFMLLSIQCKYSRNAGDGSIFVRDWDKSDIKEQRYIVTAVDKSIIQYTMCCNSSTDMWNKHLGLYEFKSECSMSSKDNVEDIIAKVEEITEMLKELGKQLHLLLKNLKKE